MFLGNTWTDITQWVYQRDPIEIERGRSDETEVTNPQTATMTLDNRDLRWSTRNPMGPWFGTIGRNAQVTVDLLRAKDTFTRTVANDWGTNDSGFGYLYLATSGTSADINVTAGKGTIRIGAAGNFAITIMNAIVMKDVDLQCDFTLPFTNVTGASVEPCNLIARYQGPGDYYMARVEVDVSEGVRVGFEHSGGGILTPQITGITHTTAQALRVRFQVEGQTLRAKVWPVGASEPLGWHAEANDAQIREAGFVGVRNGVAGGNTNVPVVVSHDNFEVRSYRFAGEVSSFPAESDVSDTDRYASIESAGMMRRLGQRESPVRTPVYQNVTRHLESVVGFWPLDEGVTSTQGAPVIGSTPIAAFQNTGVGTFKFGQDADLPSLSTCVEVARAGRLEADLDTARAITFMNTEWTVGFGMRWSTSTGAQCFFRTSTGPLLTISMTVFTDGLTEVYLSTTSASSTTVISFNQSTATLEDWHYYLITVKSATVSTIDISLTLVNNNGTSQTFNALGRTAVYARLVRMELASPFSTTEPVRLSSVVACGVQSVPFFANQIAVGYSFFGRPIEDCLTRMIRLCEENDVPFSWKGEFVDTLPMGPQPVGTFLELMRECERTDGGTLYETRGSLGLAFRTRADAYTQTAYLAMNASDLLGRFKPVEDDREPLNDVTAKSNNGGSSRYELTTGRMSTRDAPDGVGRYDNDYNVNTWYDSDLPSVAAWQVALGTVDEARFPDIQVSMDNPAGLAHLDHVLDLDVDDYFTIANATGVGIYDLIQLLNRGTTEVLVDHVHRFTLNASPSAPYDVVVLDAGLARLGSGNRTSTNALLSTTATSFAVTNQSIFDQWTTAAGDFPCPITMNGETMSLTNVTGTGTAQTFFVTRSQNGVVRTHAAGSHPDVLRPIRIGM
jgi:hypothetical protein